MIEFFNKLKKPCFWPMYFFLILRMKKISRSFGSITHNFIWVFSTMPNLEKTNDTIPTKRPERQHRQKDQRTEGRTEEGETIPIL